MYVRPPRSSRRALKDISYVLACLPNSSKMQLLGVVHELERDGFAKDGCQWLKETIERAPLSAH